MNKTFDNWWATYPEHWMKPGVEQVARLAWNAAIAEAAKVMESYCGPNGKCGSYPEIMREVRALSDSEQVK